MFVKSKRNDIFVVPKTKKRTTFLSWKKKGTIQKNELIYKIKKNNTDLYNMIYIGNAYKLGFNDKKVMLLQSKDNELFLIVNDEGYVLRQYNPYCSYDLRASLHYVPILINLYNYNEPSEHLFEINEELEEFTAIGEGITGMKFKGYKLKYIKSLIQKNNNFIEEIIDINKIEKTINIKEKNKEQEKINEQKKEEKEKENNDDFSFLEDLEIPNI